MPSAPALHASGPVPDGSAAPLAVFPDAPGVAAFIRHNPNLTNNPRMVHLTDHTTDTTTLVYGGRREVQSAAVSGDGN